jgi:potassium efflux system protein
MKRAVGSGLLLRTLILALVLLPALGWAEAPTRDQIATRLAALEADKDLPTAARDRARDHLHEAEKQLDLIGQYRQQVAEFRRLVTTLPAEIERARAAREKRTAGAPTAKALGIAGDSTLEEIEGRLTAAQLALATAEDRLTKLEEQVKALEARPQASRTRIAEAQQQLADADQAAKAAVADPSAVGQARALLQQASHEALATEIAMLTEELLSHDLRAKSTALEREAAKGERDAAEARIQALSDLANARRARETRETLRNVEQSRRQAGQGAEQQQWVLRNAELGRILAQLTEQLTNAAATRDHAARQAKQLDEQLKDVDSGTDPRGISPAVAQILREAVVQLPDPWAYREAAQLVQKRQAEGHLASYRIAEERRLTEERIARLTDTERGAQGKGSLKALLLEQRDLLDKLANAYEAYLKSAGEHEVLERRIAASSERLSHQLRQRLFWLPSAAPLNWTFATGIWGTALWLASPVPWQHIGAGAYEGFDTHRMDAPLLVAITLFLLFLSRRIGTDLARGHGDDTLRIFHAVLGAVPLPLLLAFTAHLFGESPISPRETPDLHGAFYGVAGTLFFGLALHGLAASGHSQPLIRGWPRALVERLPRYLPPLLVASSPAVFLQEALAPERLSVHAASLGRLAFLVGLAALAFSLWRVLGGWEREDLERTVLGQWRDRLRGLRFALLLVPALLMGLAAVGWYDTALQLEHLCFASAALLLGLFVLRRLGEGMLRGIGRRLFTLGDAAIQPFGQHLVHLLGAAVFLLGAGGLWLLWTEEFPRLFDWARLPLWRIGGQDGNKEMVVVSGDVALALVLLYLTRILSRDLPAALDDLLLHVFATEKSERYGATTLLRYALVLLGGVAVMNAIGLDWSHIQWLVAALSVGLGFGLQEIVANFVSGIILLFERPIRIGDIVTVGNLSGTITNIRIRATTLTDPDNKDLIIPNKVFITEKFTNWTLSSPLTRIVVQVSVAYGTDMELAHRVLIETVRGLPRAATDPEPAVWFVGFGENAISFEVRVYAREMADRTPLTHELHMAIEQAFRAHGIQIPFPQRDIRVFNVAEPLRDDAPPSPEKNTRS